MFNHLYKSFSQFVTFITHKFKNFIINKDIALKLAVCFICHHVLNIMGAFLL